MSRTVTVTNHFATPPAATFGAFAKADNLTRWLAEHAGVALERGRYEIWGRYTPGAPSEPATKLVNYDAGRRIEFDWTVRGEQTRVSVDVVPDGDETRVTISHSIGKRPFGEPSAADFWALSMENLRRFLGGNDEIVFCDYSREPRGSAEAAVEIAAPAAEVFRALVEPAELNRYIARDATIEPRIGGNYDYGWGAGPIRILEIDPPHELAYSWQYDPDGETAVHWTLEESGSRTRLELLHDGFDEDRLVEDYRTGWLKFLNEIKSMVEIGPDWKPSKLGSPDHEEET